MFTQVFRGRFRLNDDSKSSPVHKRERESPPVCYVRGRIVFPDRFAASPLAKGRSTLPVDRSTVLY